MHLKITKMYHEMLVAAAIATFIVLALFCTFPVLIELFQWNDNLTISKLIRSLIMGYGIALLAGIIAIPISFPTILITAPIMVNRLKMGQVTPIVLIGYGSIISALYAFLILFILIDDIKILLVSVFGVFAPIGALSGYITWRRIKPSELLDDTKAVSCDDIKPSELLDNKEVISYNYNFTEAKVLINLQMMNTIAMIIPYPSGVFYSNRAGGQACLYPSIESIVMPVSLENTDIGSRCALTDDICSIDVGGWGYGTITTELADAYDAVFLKYGETKNFRVDRTKLDHSAEAWLYITFHDLDTYILNLNTPLPFGKKGILTWPNI